MALPYCIPYFDAHCDTALKLYFDSKSLYDNDCMVSAKKCENYKKATYTMEVNIWKSYI